MHNEFAKCEIKTSVFSGRKSRTGNYCYGAYSHAAMERILSVQAQPKSTLESLAEHERRHLPPWLDEQPVSPRPTSDYQPLCDQEPTDHVEPTDPSDDAPAGGAAPEGPGGLPGAARGSEARATRRRADPRRERGDVAPGIPAGADQRA